MVATGFIRRQGVDNGEEDGKNDTKKVNSAMKSKGKILIVDDEPINLEFFDVMLSKLGFRIEKAADGEEALQKVVETDPDLIILDNIMPRLSGWEVTKKIKQEKEVRKFRQTPIIMFSAMDEVSDKIEGLELGVDDYITKPFNFSEVLARIRAVLRNRELAKQVSRRERRISLVESLNASLIFFTQHIKRPISGLIEAAEKLDAADRRQAEELATHVKREGAEILATLQGLEDEIEELQNKGDKLKKGDLSLEELEKKLKKNLRNWKARKTSGEAI
jgi:DNA-binding response OmpR family regulator